MDDAYCCQRAEACLLQAAAARTSQDKLRWFRMAGAWIDLCEVAREARPLLIERQLHGMPPPAPQA